MSAPGAEVCAEIILDSRMESFSGATLRVRLEDVTFAGAAAKLVDRQELRGITHCAGVEESVKVILRAAGLNPQVHYNVRAHLSRSGLDVIEAGDYVSMQSYPVLTFGHPDRLRVALNKIQR